MFVRSLLTKLQLQHRELDMEEESNKPEHGKSSRKKSVFDISQHVPEPVETGSSTRKKSVFGISQHVPEQVETGSSTRKGSVFGISPNVPEHAEKKSAGSEGSWGRTMFAQEP